MAGVKEQLLNEIWCTAPPTGYDIIRREKKKEFILNKKVGQFKKYFLENPRDFHSKVLRKIIKIKLEF